MLVLSNGAVASSTRTRGWLVLVLALTFAVVGALSIGATALVLSADQTEIPAVELTR
jgi:hypothetical protein